MQSGSRQQFITDFHEAQIAASEQVFPGKLHVIAMLTVKPHYHNDTVHRQKNSQS